MSILVEDYLMVGQNAIVRKIVQKADSAGNYSPGLQDLLSTPVCVDMIIKASTEAVNKYLPEGYITVGRGIEYIHDFSSLLGMTINVKATLTAIEGKLPQALLTGDPLALFDELGLRAELSASRNQGLAALAAAVQDAARQALA